jgi:protein gp37
MKSTKIEWTETTWNPTTGCTKISEGCRNCYAERMAHRLHAMGSDKYRNVFELTLHPELIDEPKSWRTPRTVFVNSMSDLFHEQIPTGFIQMVFQTMNACPQHTFQVLTKRADKLFEYDYQLTWSKNIWMGVTVESQKHVHRIDALRNTGANVKFLSLEPLLTAITNMDLSGIDWVIVGGESGPSARPINENWVLNIKEMCQEQQVPFFFKQWGGKNKKRAGRVLEGRVWDEMPAKELML